MENNDGNEDYSDEQLEERYLIEASIAAASDFQDDLNFNVELVTNQEISVDEGHSEADQDHNDTNEDYNDNSYNSLRERNIARNEKFLASLFGDRPSLSLASKKCDRSAPDKGTKEPVPSQSYETKLLARKDFALKTFPERKEEIEKIHSYMNKNLMNSPSLILQGPPGSGKTSILDYLLQDCIFPVAKVSCSGLSDSRLLLLHLWGQVRSAFANVAGRAILDSRPPHKISELVYLLRTCMDSLPEDYCLHLVLLQMDRLKQLDLDLCQQLLQLSKFCHPRIKVLVTSVSSTPFWSLSAGLSVRLCLRPYTDEQIRQILRRKAVEDRSFVDYHRNNNNSIDNDKQNHDSNHDNSLRLLESVLSLSLPMLTTATRHPEELWLMSRSICSLLSTSSPSHQEVQQCSSLVLTRCSVGGGDLCRHLDLNTLRPKSWFESVPLSDKFLLLAAFLASLHSKESDLRILTSAKSGRRKKPRLGTDDSIQTNTNNTTSSMSLHVLPLIPFSLERLMSILSQLYSIMGVSSFVSKGDLAVLELHPLMNKHLHDPQNFTSKVVAKQFGDSRLYASVSSLVARGLLLTTPTWTIRKPVYLSAVTQTMAEEVARSINFNLHDYMNQ